MSVTQSTIEEMVHLALREDIGEGDITAELIPADAVSLANVISRDACVFCGMDWFEEVFRQIDDQVFIEWHLEDGDTVAADDTICSLSGPSRAILTGERTALNFIQTLSATATIASRYAEAVAGTGAVVLDTRKTIPGLRAAQKYAVSCGGCRNHRMGLYDAILIKENHILAAGDIQTAVEEARFHSPGYPVEIEVENSEQLQQAIDAGVDRVLLDNFATEQIREAVKICNGRIPLEASGGITLDNIRDYAETGIDFISTGSLTKDIIAIDLSMRFSM
ncbi:MAG: carboxylating nicotinate-nucleotide diphosphorylase [Gammaproteobacteria bacterium]|nr:carboxylating nicotinate-nucleotide diphosphorylase [Gammaproteobacteria bacterium]NNL06773.1 carboxylating nicotinate-nucleotide diphosphorylase [Gammaproteobacteria bacterium]